MALTKIYPFDNPLNYTFDSNEIQISGGLANLKLQDNPGQDFIIDFASDTGFTYNSLYTEFVGGLLQQKDLRPANSVVAATFTSSLNANWGADGFADLSANINGSPSLLAGQLVCDYTVNSGQNGINYEDSLIGALSGDWVAKFKYIPSYTTSPPTNINIFSISEVTGSNNDIIIFNSPSGNNIRITANGLFANTFDTWEPTADQEYVFEIFCISNQITLFIDGVQLGAAKTISPGQGTISNKIWLGAYSNTYNVAAAKFDDLILYSTASQTPIYVIPETAYNEDIITTPELEYIGPGSLVTFDSFVTIESGEPRYTLQIGRSGDYLYWDGADWSISNNTYDQANDSITFNANLSSLDIFGEIYGQFRIYTKSSNIQEQVDNLTASLTAQIYPIDNPTILINDTTKLEELINFIETSTIIGSDQITYILKKDAVNYYYDGANWSISDGTYAQSNTAAEILTNIAIFTSSTITMSILIFLHSDNGQTTPELETLTIEYDFVGEEDLPSTTIVFGYSYNADGSPSTDTIKIRLYEDANNYPTVNQIRSTLIEVIPRADGYWEQELIDTDNMEQDSYYDFIWGNKHEKRKVPSNVESVAYNDLEVV